MTNLERAMKAANDRKMAATAVTDDSEGIVFAGSELQDRAVFSGFDIGYDELVSTSINVAGFYSQNAHSLGLRPLFISCWCDGLLTGLLLASLPPNSESDATTASDSEGKCGYHTPPCIYCQHGQKCPYELQ